MTTGHSTGTTTYTTPSDTRDRVTRVVDAPRELVFDCLDEARAHHAWMLGPEGWTMPVCEIDLRPGGVWRFVWRGADGSEMEMEGEYREVARPSASSTTSGGAATGPRRSTGGLHRARRPDVVTAHDALPVSGGARRGARNGHEGRHEQSFDRLDALPRREVHAAHPSARRRAGTASRRGRRTTSGRMIEFMRELDADLRARGELLDINGLAAAGPAPSRSARVRTGRPAVQRRAARRRERLPGGLLGRRRRLAGTRGRDRDAHLRDPRPGGAPINQQVEIHAIGEPPEV